MKAEDFEIHDHAKLDRILTKLCEMVIRGQQQDPDLGMVAAAVLDPDNRCVAGINYPQPNGQRVHAERAAIDERLSAFRNMRGADGTGTGRAKLAALKDNANYFRQRLIDMGCEVLGEAGRVACRPRGAGAVALPGCTAPAQSADSRWQNNF
jgi:hypothetical protein